MRIFLDRIRGKKLKARLEELRAKANYHHNAATLSWRGALEHAREAGRALQEAYERLGRRGRWGRWVAKNFNGSARLAREYRQIFRQWDDARLVAARCNGIGLTSIASVLKILRHEGTTPVCRRPPHPKRAYVRWLINEQIKTLTDVELDELGHSFWECWAAFYTTLRAAVCLAHDDEFFYLNPEERQEAERQKWIERRTWHLGEPPD